MIFCFIVELPNLRDNLYTMYLYTMRIQSLRLENFEEVGPKTTSVSVSRSVSSKDLPGCEKSVMKEMPRKLVGCYFVFEIRYLDLGIDHLGTQDVLV